MKFSDFFNFDREPAKVVGGKVVKSMPPVSTKSLFIEGKKVIIGFDAYRMDYGQIPFYYYKKHIWYITQDGSIYENDEKIGDVVENEKYPTLTHHLRGALYHHADMEELIPIPARKIPARDGLVHGRLNRNNVVLIDEEPPMKDLEAALSFIKRYIR